LLQDQQGNEINDLWSIEEHEVAADQIASYLRSLAGDPGSRLHCSLAGGRKTMSYFMGLSFQLVARQWDKLYHILVSPEFEKNKKFFYKPLINTAITVQNSDGSAKTLNTDDAQVQLIELPLIYLRDKFYQGGNTLRDMVNEGQRAINSSSVQVPVDVNLSERFLYIGKTLIELPPAQLTIYTAFLRLKGGACKQGVRDFCAECTSCFIPLNEMTDQYYIKVMADDYQHTYRGDSTKRDIVEKWSNNLGSDFLRQQISKINKIIKDELKDETLHPFYLIKPSKVKYGSSRYGVRVDKGKIHIE
jgi:CRISPR-associated protein Csx14